MPVPDLNDLRLDLGLPVWRDPKLREACDAIPGCGCMIGLAVVILWITPQFF